MYTRTITAAAAILATSGALALGGASPAGASTNHLEVVATASPVWTSGKALPVAVVVDNGDSQLFCSPFEVTLTWHKHKGAKHSRTVSEVAAGGVWAGTINVPARHVHNGKLKYAVSVSQECGLFSDGTVYSGRSQPSGSSTTDVI